MDWHSFGEASKEFGIAVSKVLALVLFYIFTFAWITVPIFSALFTKTLISNLGGSEGQALMAVFLWIAVAVFHMGTLSYIVGVIATRRNRFVEFAKEIWENEWKKSSRTD